MFASPGALIVYVGTVFFTNEIPSAVSDAAYEGAVKKIFDRIDAYEASDQAATAILPEIM